MPSRCDLKSSGEGQEAAVSNRLQWAILSFDSQPPGKTRKPLTKKNQARLYSRRNYKSPSPLCSCSQPDFPRLGLAQENIEHICTQWHFITPICIKNDWKSRRLKARSGDTNRMKSVLQTIPGNFGTFVLVDFGHYRIQTRFNQGGYVLRLGSSSLAI